MRSRYDILLNRPSFYPKDDIALVNFAISNYLNFNIDELLLNTDAAVFGGAVRDSLAGMSIHDVDIIALPSATRIITKRLTDRNFIPLKYSSTDLTAMYLNIKSINEPWTFFKDKIIVQIIRPVLGSTCEILAAHRVLLKTLSNVDISACGVAYFKGDIAELIETYKGAISDCKNKTFHILSDHAMYQRNRIDHRVSKLVDRGWVNRS
jgi:hypothetical protein